MNINEALVRIVRQASNTLTFNILEIGALPLGQPEPFHSLIPLFPGTRIDAFEVDPDLCEKLNAKAINGLVYHPIALGKKEEERPFYMTRHPMCASLYKSNEKLIERYNNMEVAMPKDVGTIKTVSLDHFVATNSLPAVDFIKIDIQGAELDVFRGGISTLKNVLAIVTEVEFLPLYEDQPLFGDVQQFLAKSGLAFHKFMGLMGRSLKPVVFNNNPNFATQHMWSDAVFLRNLTHLDVISPEQLLKLAVLAAMYGSPDVSVYCLLEYDARLGTKTSRELMSYFQGGPVAPDGA